MTKIFQIGLLIAMIVQGVSAEDLEAKTARFRGLAAGEYHLRFLEAIDSGKLDLADSCIPVEIKNDDRAKAFFRAGFYRGVGLYQVESELKNTNSERGCIPLTGVFKWEREGFIKGCATALKVGNAIQKDINGIIVRELQRDNSTPDSAVEAATRMIEQQRSAREKRAEQAVPPNGP